MEASKLSVKELKAALTQRGVDFRGCLEKSDLVEKYLATMPKPGSVQKRQETIGQLSCKVIDVIGQEGAPKLAFLLLHGYGANADDLLPIAHQLADSWSLGGQVHLQCIVPEGLLGLGGASRAWFPLDFMKLMTTPPLQLAEASLPGLDTAAEEISSLMSFLEGQGFNRFVLSGFSQGAILCTHVAARYARPEQVLAFGLMSAAVQARPSWVENLPKYKHAKVLLSHGRADPVLPYAMGEMLKGMFESAGVPVDFVPFDGGHTIPMDVIRKLMELVNSTGSSVLE